MMIFDNTCMSCTKRHIGCHGTCEDYIEAKIKFEKEKAIVKKNRDNQRDVDNFKHSNIEKMKKGKSK